MTPLTAGCSGRVVSFPYPPFFISAQFHRDCAPRNAQHAAPKATRRRRSHDLLHRLGLLATGSRRVLSRCDFVAFQRRVVLPILSPLSCFVGSLAAGTDNGILNRHVELMGSRHLALDVLGTAAGPCQIRTVAVWPTQAHREREELRTSSVRQPVTG